jgi:hypothetical protein
MPDRKYKTSSYQSSEDVEKNLLILTGTKEFPGICKTRQHAIEFSLRLTASRLRMGMDLRPLMNGATEKAPDAEG